SIRLFRAVIVRQDNNRLPFRRMRWKRCTPIMASKNQFHKIEWTIFRLAFVVFMIYEIAGFLRYLWRAWSHSRVLAFNKSYKHWLSDWRLHSLAPSSTPLRES